MKVSKYDIFFVTKGDQKHTRNTTSGWELLVRCKDQIYQWIHLKDMKELHPIKVVDFSKARGIFSEPYFT